MNIKFQINQRNKLKNILYNAYIYRINFFYICLLLTKLLTYLFNYFLNYEFNYFLNYEKKTILDIGPNSQSPN